LTIQTRTGTHGTGPVTGNPAQFDCAPETGGGVSATSLHLPSTATAWQARNIDPGAAVASWRRPAGSAQRRPCQAAR